MLFIRIQINKDELSPRTGYNIYYKNGINVEYLPGNQDTFFYEFDNFFVMGESSVEMTRKSVYETSEKIRSAKSITPPVNKNLHSLFIIDTTNQEVTTFNNISNNNSYYYYQCENLLICSSNIKKLLELDLDFEFNEEVLPEFFVYRYIIAPRTFFKNIYRLYGGQVRRSKMTNGKEISSIFWQPPKSDESLINNKLMLLDKFDNIFSSYMDENLNQYKKPGLLFSGGLDSSVIASIALNSKKDYNSISTSFSFLNPDDMEDSYAYSAAEYFNLEHKTFNSTTEQFLTGIVKSIYFAEEPIHHIQSALLYLLFENCSKTRNDILLCGEAADSLVGNELHQLVFRNKNLLKIFQNTGLGNIYKFLFKILSSNDYRLNFLNHYFGDNHNNKNHILWTISQFCEPVDVMNMISCNFDSIIESRKKVANLYESCSLLDRIALMAFHGSGSITMCIWKKMAESQGLHILYPFSNPKAMDYFFSIPWEIKAQEKKFINRALLRKFNVPEDLITRRKKSFGINPSFWALPNRLFQPFVDMAAELFDPSFLKTLQVTDYKKSMLLWNIINIYLWKKLFIEKVSPDDISEEIIYRHRMKKI